MTVREEHVSEEEIHLFVESAEANDSVVALRWCICKRIFENIKNEREFSDPYLLLIVTYEGREVERRLVPLDQMMEYIWFQRPGSHKIFAAIILRYKKHEHRMRGDDFYRYFLGKKRYDRDTYDYQMVDFDNNRLIYVDCFYYCRGKIGETMIEVVIPEGFFAKKPPNWLFNWVNYWYETLPRDQCQFRRRSMLAFSVQPPILLAWISGICLIRALIVLFFILCGMRKIRFSPVVHPLSLPTKEIWYDFDDKDAGSVFFYNKQGEPRPLFFMPFVPVFFLLFFGIWYSLTREFWLSTEVAASFILLSAITLALAKPFLTVLGRVLDYVFKLFARIIPSYENRRRWREDKYENKKRKRKEKKEKAFLEHGRKLEETFLPIICTGAPVEPKFEAIPKKHRTFYLWYRHTKAKVCKPFAR